MWCTKIRICRICVLCVGVQKKRHLRCVKLFYILHLIWPQQAGIRREMKWSSKGSKPSIRIWQSWILWIPMLNLYLLIIWWRDNDKRIKLNLQSSHQSGFIRNKGALNGERSRERCDEAADGASKLYFYRYPVWFPCISFLFFYLH